MLGARPFMLVPLLIFMAVGLLSYASFVKLSARILRYKVTWTSSFLFAVIMLIVVIVTRIFDVGQAPLIVIGHGVVVIAGLVILGSWFFAKRGTDPAGQVLGFERALRLSGFAFLLMFVTAGALFLLTHVIFHIHPTSPP